jgi:hypothetical protein
MLLELSVLFLEISGFDIAEQSPNGVSDILEVCGGSRTLELFVHVTAEDLRVLFDNEEGVVATEFLKTLCHQICEPLSLLGNLGDNFSNGCLAFVLYDYSVDLDLFQPGETLAELCDELVSLFLGILEPLGVLLFDCKNILTFRVVQILHF